MAYKPPAASYDLPDSKPWGEGDGYGAFTAGYGRKAEDGFYDTRDDVAGGTDNAYNQGEAGVMGGANWASEGDTAPTVDAGTASTGGVLSQDSLAG